MSTRNSFKRMNNICFNPLFIIAKRGTCLQPDYCRISVKKGIRKKEPAIAAGRAHVLAYCNIDYASFSFAVAQRAVNAAGSAIAISESIFLLISTLASLSPYISLL